MFKIEYKVSSTFISNLNPIKEEEIQYNFLLGSILIISDSGKIQMDWEWIPLLDFTYCLSEIVKDLNKKPNSNEYFEFTESTETIQFVRNQDQLIIIPSFESIILNTTFADFQMGVFELHTNIKNYIIKNISKDQQNRLKKYLNF